MMNLLPLFDTDFLFNVLSTVVEQSELAPLPHVGAVDSWPSQLTRGMSAAMIFNTDNASEPGEHWVAVFIHGPLRRASIFDSLPVRPFPYEVQHKLGEVCDSVVNVNPQRLILQQPDFPFCGLFCLAFLDHACTFKTFNLCVDSQLLNDVSVAEHVLPLIEKTFTITFVKNNT
jgi:hypothetical protein